MLNHSLLIYRILCLFLLSGSGCSSNKSLTFTPTVEIAEALGRGMVALNQFYGGSNQNDFYAVVRNNSHTQIILCKKNDTPDVVNALLRKSGRYLVLNNTRIPFFYFFDTQSDLVVKENAGQWMFGGYAVEFDFQFKVLQEGMVF